MLRPAVRVASDIRRYDKCDTNGKNRTVNRDVNAGRNIRHRGMFVVLVYVILKNKEK